MLSLVSNTVGSGYCDFGRCIADHVLVCHHKAVITYDKTRAHPGIIPLKTVAKKMPEKFVPGQLRFINQWQMT
jgi:hypothetical protein